MMFKTYNGTVNIMVFLSIPFHILCHRQNVISFSTKVQGGAVAPLFAGKHFGSGRDCPFALSGGVGCARKKVLCEEEYDFLNPCFYLDDIVLFVGFTFGF